MSDMSAPHAKAAKSGPWCNTTPTLRQRATRRRHSLGGADELQAPRSLGTAEVVSKDATPTAARGEDAGVPASDLTGSSPPQPPVEYYRAGYETADGREVDLNDDDAFLRSLVEEMKGIVLQEILDIERRALERERGWSEVTEDDDDERERGWTEVTEEDARGGEE